MPQNDVLAHRNVILFLSHGGLLGTIEALHHGVPILAIPIFADQFRNAHRVMAAGSGHFLHLDQITIESLTKVITEMTTNETYRQRADYISNTFTENRVHIMDEAMFWIEHVAKFKGATHLKSHAVHLPWFTYLMLDIIVANVLIVVIAPLALYISIGKLFARKRNAKNTNLSVKKKK